VALNQETGAAADVRASVRNGAPAGRRLALAADRLWRSIAQVFLFGLFGLCGVVMTVLIAPALTVLIRDRRTRTVAARRCVQGVLLAFTGAMQALRVLRFELIGRERLQGRGVLIVANHPTLIDALFLLGRVGELVPIAKRALLANFFTRGAIRAADYLANDAGPALVEACRERLRRGESLLLFPEATRTAADGEIRLRRGAAQVAVRSGCLVVPVTVFVSERFLTRGTPWWLASKSAPLVRIVAGAPIDPAPFVAANGNPALAARRLTEHLQQLYSKELASRGSA
jgi:1-acyl-sn-glycerol-3-phosphate acyltransferase